MEHIAHDPVGGYKKMDDHCETLGQDCICKHVHPQIKGTETVDTDYGWNSSHRGFRHLTEDPNHNGVLIFAFGIDKVEIPVYA